MGKTAKLKKGAKSFSIHSRAAKRASSPSIDTDKSLKGARPPTETNARPILSTHHASGVTKRKSKEKPMSRNQRMKLEKGSQRAEVVMDQLEKKLEDSVRKGKTVKGRSLAWDEVNGVLEEKLSKRKQKKKKVGDDWEDEDNMGLANEGVVPEDVPVTETVDVVELAPKLAKSTLDEPEEEDEIL